MLLQGPDCAEAGRGGQVLMGKLLLWFGILYGNLSAMVGIAVIVVWWTKQSSGRQFCADFGMPLTTCRSALLVLDVLVMGVATLLSFRRLSVVRRSFEKSVQRSERQG
jgi:hypothetical protein